MTNLSGPAVPLCESDAREFARYAARHTIRECSQLIGLSKGVLAREALRLGIKVWAPVERRCLGHCGTTFVPRYWGQRMCLNCR